MKRKRKTTSKATISERKITVYRNKKGRFTRKRKGRRGETWTILEETDPMSGDVRELGRIREKSSEIISRFNSTEKNFMVRGFIDDEKLETKLKRMGARGVEVTIRGRAGRKDRRVRVRVVFRKSDLRAPGVVRSIIVGRVLKAMAAFDLRLSTIKIGGKRGRQRLKKVSVTVKAFL